MLPWNTVTVHLANSLYFSHRSQSFMKWKLGFYWWIVWAILSWLGSRRRVSPGIPIYPFSGCFYLNASRQPEVLVSSHGCFLLLLPGPGQPRVRTLHWTAVQGMVSCSGWDSAFWEVLPFRAQRG